MVLKWIDRTWIRSPKYHICLRLLDVTKLVHTPTRDLYSMPEAVFASVMNDHYTNKLSRMKHGYKLK